MVRAVVRSHKADEQVVVALGGDGKGEGLGQSLAEIQASRPGSGSSFKKRRGGAAAGGTGTRREGTACTRDGAGRWRGEIGAGGESSHEE